MNEADGTVLAGRAPRRWRRVAVSLALGPVALAVVGMHQLSLGHLLVTGAGGGQAHGGGAHSAAAALMGGGPAASMPMPADHAATGDHATTASAVHPVMPTDDGCAGCGDHVMGPGTCVLALTLLVLFWWLRLPRARSLPPVRRERGPSAFTPRPRPPLRALSLLELSVLRT